MTELLLHRLGLVWTPEPEGLAPCWKALLSGSPNFDSLYEQLVQPRREILAFSPLAADALLLDAFYADEMRPLPVEWEPFLSTRQLALHRSLQGRWEEALAAVQQAEPMASGEMEQRMLALVRYRLEHPDYLHDDTYGTQLLDCFQRLRDTYPMGFTRFHLPWVLAWYKANRQYRQACRLLEEFPVK